MISAILGFIIMLAFYVGIFVFARERGRSGVLWLLISIFITPVLAFILLLILRKNP